MGNTKSSKAKQVKQTLTEPILPPRVIVRQGGVIIEHYYRSDDHAYAVQASIEPNERSKLSPTQGKDSVLFIKNLKGIIG